MDVVEDSQQKLLAAMDDQTNDVERSTIRPLIVRIATIVLLQALTPVWTLSSQESGLLVLCKVLRLDGISRRYGTMHRSVFGARRPSPTIHEPASANVIRTKASSSLAI